MFLFISAKHVRKALTWRRNWRALHVHLSTGNELVKLEEEATHLSLGVGFVAAYAPHSSSSVWIQPYDILSNVFGESGRWHRLQVPAERAPIREVACGRSHLVALTTDGNAYTAGLNTFGQCGTGRLSSDKGKMLSHVTGLDEEISHVACGLDHTLFLSNSGRVFSCGWSTDGQTGVNSYSNVTSPTRVHLPSDLCFSSVYTCADTAFSQTRSGQLYGWGNNEYGQVGVSSEEDQLSIPIPLDLPDLDSQLVSVATGGAFTALLTSCGSVYRVGYAIEEPSLSHDKLSGKLLSQQQLCKVRKVHKGQSSGHICRIHAGLHYLVGELSSQEVILWGRYPDSGRSQQVLSWRRKIKLDSGVLSIAYGPSSIAVLTSDQLTNPMSFL